MGASYILTIFIFYLQICDEVDSANILFYHHVASYSHRIATYPLADALAKRGHQITFISPYHPRGPYINPNITEIVPKKFAASMEAFLASDFDINFRIKKQLPNSAFSFFPATVRTCQDLLESEEFRKYLEKTTKLDLMITDNCLSECSMAIKYKYKVKHITFGTITTMGMDYDLYGLIPESSSIPEVDIYPPRPPMGFVARFKNAWTSLYFRFLHYFWYEPQIDHVIRKNMGFGDEMPFVDELYRDTSLVLSMGDLVTDFPRLLPPLIVYIGGIQCQGENEKKELPQELRHFIESDSEGFVYISLGSLVVSSNLPEDLKQAFFRAIESFPKLKFIWKWNGEFPEKIPENLYLGKWFPQQDLLAHPKIKAFVTQSGRPSTIEAVCAAVPMIAFPVIGDQDFNAIRINGMGGNILFEMGEVSGEQFREALETVVYDKRMKERMLELQNILNDQPMSPMERAIWWTEYVLRHKDTSHLRPAGFGDFWFKRRLLDVWAFSFLMVLIALIVYAFFVKMMLKCLCSRKKGTENLKLKKR